MTNNFEKSQVEEDIIETDEDPAGSIMQVDDEALASITGGCGGGKTPQLSPCPPMHCY